ncbi:MAG: PLDc N-terminal domain-containing protein [Chloroflexota bacterium]|nr:MAG: hypothetical protein DLM70_11815 [Chloroflexota bacterium]
MKLILEVVISLVLHPVAMVLAWIDILRRRDLSLFRKAIWVVVCLIWGIGPLLYIAVGDGKLW